MSVAFSKRAFSWCHVFTLLRFCNGDFGHLSSTAKTQHLLYSLEADCAVPRRETRDKIFDFCLLGFFFFTFVRHHRCCCSCLSFTESLTLLSLLRNAMAKLSNLLVVSRGLRFGGRKAERQMALLRQLGAVDLQRVTFIYALVFALIAMTLIWRGCCCCSLLPGAVRPRGTYTYNEVKQQPLLSCSADRRTDIRASWTRLARM